MPNGSFENYSFCPYFEGQVIFIDNWNMYGSADYFNKCSSTVSFSTPINWAGYQLPENGDAYIGITTYADYYPDAREYVWTQLSVPLVIGKNYLVEFYICSAKSQQISANFYSNNIGCLFTTYTPNNIIPNNFAQINKNSLLNDTVNWVKIKGVFTADSAYNYIILGNFFNDSSTSIGTYLTDSLNISYYYIDDVRVYDVNDNINNTKTCIGFPNIFSPNGDGKNDLLILPCDEIIKTSIFNRWGDNVFKTEKRNLFWDGRTISGELCPDGTYFYIIETEESVFKGFIQLIR